MVLINFNSEEEFIENITSGDLVAVMITKTGCPFCEKAKPWMNELGDDLNDRKVAIINKDNLPNLLEKFNLAMYPTFLLIKEGKVLDVFYGDTQENKVKDFISKSI